MVQALSVDVMGWGTTEFFLPLSSRTFPARMEWRNAKSTSSSVNLKTTKESQRSSQMDKSMYQLMGSMTRRLK